MKSKVDGRGPSSTLHERQKPNQEHLEPSEERLAQGGERLEGRGERLGPIIHEDLGQATDGRESNLYMLYEGPLRVA